MHRITIIENFITPADAATLIQQQLDPNSEKIHIQNITLIDMVELRYRITKLYKI